jgi:hypothetical protein
MCRGSCSYWKAFPHSEKQNYILTTKFTNKSANKDNGNTWVKAKKQNVVVLLSVFTPIFAFVFIRAFIRAIRGKMLL